MNNTDWLLGITVFQIVKWFFVVGLVMYLAFAVVIVRQVSIMSEAMEDPRNPVVKLIAWVHLLMALLLLIMSILVL